MPFNMDPYVRKAARTVRDKFSKRRSEGPESQPEHGYGGYELEYESGPSGPTYFQRRIQAFRKAVDLREYQADWDLLRQTSSGIDPNALKAIYNYIGKSLYGRNAREEIIVSTLKRDLNESPGTTDQVLTYMLGLGLIEAID